MTSTLSHSEVPLAGDSVAPAPQRSVLSDLREIVADFRRSRDLLVQLTLRDIRVRYKQAALGFAWALLLPITIVLAGLAVRVAISVASGHSLEREQLARMAIKSVPWAFFVGCIGTGTPSLIGNITLVTKVYFPREVLPIAACIAQGFDSAIGLLAVVIIIPFLGVTASLQLLWVPLLLLLLGAFTVGTVLFLSCANLFFRDVKYMVQVFLSFGIFFTPVLVDAPMFGARFAPIVMLNPISPILEGLRLAVVDHHNLLTPVVSAPGGWVSWHPWYLAYAAAWAIGGLLASVVFFHRSERRFALFV
jgi:ABC-type polysaccharide/polyol phosphate export permease